jgi:hypothetical protein
MWDLYRDFVPFFQFGGLFQYLNSNLSDVNL